MKAILKFIDDLRKVMAEQYVQMEVETDTYTWGVMNDSLAHMEHACATLETAANVRIHASSTPEERHLYTLVVLHRKPYPTKGQ